MTRSVFGIKDGWGNTIVRAIWIVIAIVIMYMFGWHSLVAERLGEIWAIILAFFVAFALIFSINIILAPNEIDELRKQLDDKEARQNAIDTLWALREEGVVLRNKKLPTGIVVSSDGFENWRRSYKEWRENVLTEAGKVNINLKCYLETLDKMGAPPANVEIVNSEHGLYVNIISEMLQRLQEYLKKEL